MKYSRGDVGPMSHFLRFKSYVANVHMVLGSHMRPCQPSALDLTIGNTWVRLQQSSQGGSL